MRFGKLFLFLQLYILLLFTACTNSDNQPVNNIGETAQNIGPVFRALPEEKTGISFKNIIKETEGFNYFNFEYIYNGGGVGIGDFNQDGLQDVYLTGNLVADQLYINKGDLKFENATSSLPETNEGWNTGVTVADINGDGRLDIYVCRAGKKALNLNLENLLFINTGNDNSGVPKFVEQAKEFGLADDSPSVQSSFFDYDKDGDLDVYIMNHPSNFKENLNPKAHFELLESGKAVSDRLYRNEGNTFVDVSEEAGIRNHAFGLGLSVSDINNDGFPDVYVSNDFDEPDFFYINNGKGQFVDQLRKRTKHISNFGMGTDIADFNNDGLEDMITLDMSFADHVRSKRNMAAMSPEKFYALVESGKHHQYMSNSLQLNTGNGTFSEVAQLAGVAKTDWGWAPLLADFDNDGWNDLLITNGYKRDLGDRDFQNKLAKTLKKGEKLSLEETFKLAPSTVIGNYLFKNNKNLTFENVSKKWGFEEDFNSNGVAYADLDGDGDLDLVVNNMEAVASVYENTSQNNGNHFLKIALKGTANNPFAYGTKVFLLEDNLGILARELLPAKGYQSSVDQVLHFGLGNEDLKNLKLYIVWPFGKQTLIENPKIDQQLTIDFKSSKFTTEIPFESKAAFFIEDQQRSNIGYKHKENDFDDFEKEILLPHKQSQHGPMISVGDVNKDNLDDFFVGGAAGSAGALYLQKPDGKFYPSESGPWESDKESEDLGSLFFDADGDGDLDLYVVSGGNEFEADDKALQDRLYINSDGQFTKSKGLLPKMRTSGKAIASIDFDQDGDLDIFLGGRLIPGTYPKAPRSYLLENEGGTFKDVTKGKAPGLLQPGLVTDVSATDYDGDGDTDLIVVGELMPVRIFKNEKGNFFEASEEAGLAQTEGFWFSITAADLNNDGKDDFILGNMGKNQKFKASVDKPFNVYADDFDNNGSLDIVLSTYENDINYPVRGRECSSQQMPFIKDKFPTFQAFAEADLPAIFTEEQLEKALHLVARTFESTVMINNGDGTFELKKLPKAAQIAPINCSLVKDLDKDGHLDIILAGNMFGAEVETVRHDAGAGLCLKGDGMGNFTPFSLAESGFFVPANVKDMQFVEAGNPKHPVVLVANNNYIIQAFDYKR